MGLNYIQEMANHKRKQLEEKIRNINEDNTNLNKLEKKYEAEQYRQTISRIKQKRNQDELLKIREEQRNFENNIKNQEKYDFNNMVQENIQKEINREHDFKNIFQNYENKHKNRIKYHQDFLKNNHSKFDNVKDLYEKKYFEEKQQLNDIITMNTKIKHDESTRKNFDIVKLQLEKKHMDRIKDAELHRRSIEQRFKEDDFNKQLDRMEKEERMKTKLMYNDFLKQQIDLKKSQRHGTMTDIEVKLNRYDIPELNGSKVVQSLIPGINHIDSIGSKPTCRRGVSLSPLKDNLKFEQPVTERAHLQKGRDSRSSTRKHISRNGDAKQYHSLQRNKTTEQIGSTSLLNGTGLHNPITNPLNLHNPYSKSIRDQVIRESKSYRGGIFNNF